MMLLCLQDVTSFKVNVHKSEMLPIGEVSNVHILVEILGCRVGTLPMSYLNMPLGASHSHPLFGIQFWKKKLRESWPGSRCCIC